MFTLSDISHPIIDTRIRVDPIDDNHMQLVESNEDFNDRLIGFIPFMEDFPMEGIIMSGRLVAELALFKIQGEFHYNPVSVIELYILENEASLDDKNEDKIKLIVYNIYQHLKAMCYYETIKIERTETIVTLSISYDIVININLNIVTNLIDISNLYHIDCDGCIWDGTSLLFSERSKLCLENNAIVYLYSPIYQNFHKLAYWFLRGMSILFDNIEEDFEILKFKELTKISLNYYTAKFLYITALTPSYKFPTATALILPHEPYIDIFTIQPEMSLIDTLMLLRTNNRALTKIFNKEELAEIEQKYITLLKPLVESTATAISAKLAIEFN